MTLFFLINLQSLADLGKDYPWPDIRICPCCKSRLWKHGFVTAWFFGFDFPLFIRRLRCPDCKKVIQIRPSSHWGRFQYPINTIKKSIVYRFYIKRWHKEAKIENQRTWLLRLKRQIRIFLGLSYDKGFLSGFFELLKRGLIPVSCSNNPKINPYSLKPTF